MDRLRRDRFASDLGRYRPRSHRSRRRRYAKELADTFDGFGRYSEIVGWSADSTSLYFTEMKHTVVQVGRLYIDGKSEVVGPSTGVANGGVHLNTTSTHFGFSFETLNQPPEAHISAVGQLKATASSAM